MELRPYRRDAVNSVYAYFEQEANINRNPLIAMPTGTGKSVVIAQLAKELCTTFHNYRITIVTHVKELIKQDYDHFINLWPTAPAGIYSAGMKRKETHARITFAGIQSIYTNSEYFEDTDLIIIDEAHRIDDKRPNCMSYIPLAMNVNIAMRTTGTLGNLASAANAIGM
jgi:DNA repair protein RadD